jgi:hypothetical protein
MTSASPDWKFRQILFYFKAMLAKHNSSLNWQLSKCPHRSTICLWLSKFRIFMISSQNYAGNIRKSIKIMRKEKFATLNTRYLNGDIHNDRNVSVTSQFRSVAVAERECLTWRNGSEAVCTCSIPIMWTVLRLLHYTTHSSEYSSGSPDEPGVQRNRVCNANSALARASGSAQTEFVYVVQCGYILSKFPSQLYM